MKVNIVRLKKTTAGAQTGTGAQPFLFTALTQDIFPESTGEEGSFWQNGEITVEGAVVNKGQTLEAAGVIIATVKCLCNLCLEEISIKMEVPFCREYRESEAADSEMFPDEPDEADFDYYTGEKIDFRPLVRETLLLAQPLRQVCREDCRGLCPECGANLNITGCGCADKKINPRMSVLENLLKKEKDS